MDCYTELKHKLKKLNLEFNIYNFWTDIDKESININIFSLNQNVWNMCNKNKTYNKYVYSLTLFNFYFSISYKRKI